MFVYCTVSSVIADLCNFETFGIGKGMTNVSIPIRRGGEGRGRRRKFFYFATFHNTEGSTDDNNDNGDDGDANTDDNDTYMHVTQLVRITTITCWIVNYGVVVVSNSVVAALESTGVVTIYV